MAIHPLWSDEYWLLLMQVFMKKPVGMKPLYSKALVDLSIELHIPPQVLYEQMFRLRRADSPQLELLHKTYGGNPRKLKKETERIRRMRGFGNGGAFYDGVEVRESFERDFRPIDLDETDGFGAAPVQKANEQRLMPIMIILILDLYFRLTPITMVEETPEIVELARLMRVSASTVVEVMEVLKFCDPYLNRADFMISPLVEPCQEAWNRFGNDNPEKLSSLAAQLKEYFK